MVSQAVIERYEEKEKHLGPLVMRDLEKMVLLTTIDQLWKDHLLAMDHLREGINLRGYGQKDPLLEYKKEGFNYFRLMISQISFDVVRRVFEIQVQEHIEQEQESESVHSQIAEMAPKPVPMVMKHGDELVASSQEVAGLGNEFAADKVGRNDPCPCGSGKKFKKCHGA
jgi:preprotein translocase subunit SecA